jgi:hypothetical protein
VHTQRATVTNPWRSPPAQTKGEIPVRGWSAHRRHLHKPDPVMAYEEGDVRPQFSICVSARLVAGAWRTNSGRGDVPGCRNGRDEPGGAARTHHGHRRPSRLVAARRTTPLVIIRLGALLRARTAFCAEGAADSRQHIISRAGTE